MPVSRHSSLTQQRFVREMPSPPYGKSSSNGLGVEGDLDVIQGGGGLPRETPPTMLGNLADQCELGLRGRQHHCWFGKCSGGHLRTSATLSKPATMGSGSVSAPEGAGGRLHLCWFGECSRGRPRMSASLSKFAAMEFFRELSFTSRFATKSPRDTEVTLLLRCLLPGVPVDSMRSIPVNGSSEKK